MCRTLAVRSFLIGQYNSRQTGSGIWRYPVMQYETARSKYETAKWSLRPRGWGAGGTPLFGLCMRLCAAEQAMVFRVLQTGVRVLRLSKTGYTILLQGVFLDWKSFKECEDLRWTVYICNTDNFFLNIYFHDFSVKKITKFCMQIRVGK